MATTSPDGIYSPDAGQQYALTQDLLAMADSVQGALSDSRSSESVDTFSSLPTSGNWAGSIIMTRDSGRSYSWNGTTWVSVVAYQQITNPGTFLATTDIVQTAGNYAPMFASGMVVSGTDIQFGSGYMPAIGLPFPNGVLTLQLTEIVGDGATKSASGIAFDVFTKSQFRAFYPGDTASVKRAFTYLAVGY